MKRKVVGALGLTLALTTVSLNVANAAPKKKPAKTEQVREAPQSAEISKAMGDLKWGTSRDDVLQYYKNQVKAKYKPLLAKATGALEEDKLLKKQADELSAISRSVVEFDGSKTGIDAGFLRTEFTHHNSESMFSTTDDHSKNYYFFINGKLWKWYKAFEASAFNGKSFDEFAAAIQERYGKAQVREGDLGTGSKSRWLEWQDTQTRLRAVDNKQFYGFYSLVFESKDVVQKLPQLRAHKADTAPKGHALVDSVTNGDDGPNDNEKDIVDRITGKMRVRQDAPAGTPATAGTTGKKSPTAAAPAPSTGTAGGGVRDDDDPLKGLL